VLPRQSSAHRPRSRPIQRPCSSCSTCRPRTARTRSGPALPCPALPCLASLRQNLYVSMYEDGRHNHHHQRSASRGALLSLSITCCTVLCHVAQAPVPKARNMWAGGLWSARAIFPRANCASFANLNQVGIARRARQWDLTSVPACARPCLLSLSQCQSMPRHAPPIWLCSPSVHQHKASNAAHEAATVR
jgi:hypothetical protein